MPSALFRVLLLRRLRLLLPLAPRRCSCRGQLDALGDYRTACATSGVLATRALSIEHAVARVCREAGARVARNVRLADMNLEVPVADDFAPEKRATPRAGRGTGHCRRNGILVLGSPLGSREFVSSTLAAKRGQQDELLARLPALQKLQSAWMLLLLCAAPRCNYLLRTVPASLRNSPPRAMRRSRDPSR